MSRRPLVALLLVIGLASCGVEVFGSGGQTTLETTSSTSLATTTSIAPTTTAPTPTTEPVDACVQAEPVARVFRDLVEFAMKDWEPIAANQVSGAEAAALLTELRGPSWPSGVSWTPHRSQTLSCEPSPGTSTNSWRRSSQASTNSRWPSRAAQMTRCSTTTVSRSTPCGASLSCSRRLRTSSGPGSMGVAPTSTVWSTSNSPTTSRPIAGGGGPLLRHQRRCHQDPDDTQERDPEPRRDPRQYRVEERVALRGFQDDDRQQGNRGDHLEHGHPSSRGQPEPATPAPHASQDPRRLPQHADECDADQDPGEHRGAGGDGKANRVDLVPCGPVGQEMGHERPTALTVGDYHDAVSGLGDQVEVSHPPVTLTPVPHRPPAVRERLDEMAQAVGG